MGKASKVLIEYSSFCKILWGDGCRLGNQYGIVREVFELAREAAVWKDELIDMKSNVHYFRFLNVFAFLNVLSPTVSPLPAPFISSNCFLVADSFFVVNCFKTANT
jgi:hypothetical protein